MTAIISASPGTLLGTSRALATAIEIDLNVRVRGNQTFAPFEDADGDMAVGEDVEVYETESGLVGSGRVTEIDPSRAIVYLSVDWASLREGRPARKRPSPGHYGLMVIGFAGAVEVSAQHFKDWYTINSHRHTFDRQQSCLPGSVFFPMAHEDNSI